MCLKCKKKTSSNERIIPTVFERMKGPPRENKAKFLSTPIMLIRTRKGVLEKQLEKGGYIYMEKEEYMEHKKYLKKEIEELHIALQVLKQRQRKVSWDTNIK